MAIKVTFSQGQTETKAPALHQWDRGQMLEIESTKLPNIVEVHFACRSMTEAARHVCSVNNGVAVVAIPDRCLEQSESITAWVYEVDGSTGTTIMTITIPVIARTRPSRDEEVPAEVSDTYTELIEAVNEAVEDLVSGKVMVSSAAKATSADRATWAENASSAANATSAGFATSAGTATSATKAMNDNVGDPIHVKYASFKDDFTLCTAGSILLEGTYQVAVCVNTSQQGTTMPLSVDEVASNPSWFSTIMTIDKDKEVIGNLGWSVTSGQFTAYAVRCSANTTSLVLIDSNGSTYSNAEIYVRRINEN